MVDTRGKKRSAIHTVQTVETSEAKRRKIATALALYSVFEDEDVMSLICSTLPLEAADALARVTRRSFPIMRQAARHRALQRANAHPLARFLTQYTQVERVRLLTIGSQSAHDASILERLKNKAAAAEAAAVKAAAVKAAAAKAAAKAKAKAAAKAASAEAATAEAATAVALYEIARAVRLYEIQAREDPDNRDPAQYDQAWNVLWQTTKGAAKTIAFSRQQNPGRLEQYCNFIGGLASPDPAYMLPITHVLVSSYEAVHKREMVDWREMTFVQFQLLHQFVKIAIHLYENGQVAKGFWLTQQCARANLFAPVVKFILADSLVAATEATDRVHVHTRAEVAFLALRALVVTGNGTSTSEVEERKRMAMEANVHEAAFRVLKTQSRSDALEACRILWWLCKGSAERARRVAQMDCHAELVRALHDDNENLKFMAARALLGIMQGSGYKDMPAWKPFFVAHVPPWFKMIVVVHQQRACTKLVLYARVADNETVVPPAEFYSVGHLKKIVLAQPLSRAAQHSAENCRLFLNGAEMIETKSLAHYSLDANSIVTLRRRTMAQQK